MFLIDKIKATINFWNNYGKENLDSKVINLNLVPEYVEDLEIEPFDLSSKDVSVIHQMKQSCAFDINVPAHAPRKNSNLFNQSRKHLIDDLKTPCWICGSFENLEAHHYIIEAAMANCIDWSKVKKDYPDFKDWSKIDQSNQDTFYLFYDSVFNLRILCKDHHIGSNKTGKGSGIHFCVYPVWQLQKYQLDSYKLMNY